jgi:hypothetical protein
VRSISLLVCLALAGCTLERQYIGSPLPRDPVAVLEVGKSTKADALRELGPPERLVRQYDGDVFVYAFVRRNSSSFTLGDPAFTNLTIFSWSKTQEKSDRLVLTFDHDGRLTGYGYRRGTDDLETF